MPVLARSTPAGGEAPAVPDAINVIDDQHLEIAQQEITCSDTAAAPPHPRPYDSDNQRLTDHLPPNTRCQPTCGVLPRNKIHLEQSRGREG